MTWRVIYKYTIPLGAMGMFDLSPRAQVKMVGIDPTSGAPAMWVEQDPSDVKVERRFRIVATGEPIGGDGNFPSDIHVGTVIDAPYVWHIYEQRDHL